MRISTLSHGKKFNNFVKTHISCISTSSAQYAKRRWVPYGFPKSKESHKRNLKITNSRPELFRAQKKRQPWDYPLADDQRASWKHTQWYDQFYEKWVDIKPVVKKKDFDINIKEKRALIHDQETLVNKFYLLLDRDTRRKYIIKPFNMAFARNSSYFYQHLTNTKFVHGMPYCIDSMPVSSSMLEDFENHLTNILQLELIHNKTTAVDKNHKRRTDRILTMIVQHLLTLASHDDFQDCEVDQNPENSMYWLRGRGFHKWSLAEDLPFLFQSHDTPLYQIRMKERLPEFTPWMDDYMLHTELPHCKFPPQVYGIPRVTYRNTITPGIRYQAGDIEMNYDEAFEQKKLKDLPPPIPFQHLFGHTQFFSLPQEFDRECYKANLHHCDITDQIEEHIKAHGIMSGWTWTAAQAHYIGHWMDNDIEKPISIQTVITDGEYMSFFCYQLNTVAIDPENADENPRRNICYGTPMMRLFNKVQGTDDIELYQDTLNLLLKFAMNNSQAKVDREKAIAHNSTLEVQEWDRENPVIELQKPKHIKEQERLREEEEKKRLQSEKKTMKDKFLSKIRRK